MRDAGKRFKVLCVCALLGVAYPGHGLRAQTPCGSATVTASSDQATPYPPCINDEVMSDLSASAQGTNPPPSAAMVGENPQPCTVTSTWSWSILTVSYSPSPGGNWTQVTSGYSASIEQGDPTSGAASLFASFGSAGYWKVTCQASASLSDSPCTDCWSGAGTTDVYVTVIDCGTGGGPGGAGRTVQFDSANYTVAEGATIEIGVTLSSVSSTDVTVSYATSDGTAKAGVNYTTNSGVLTIPAGSLNASFPVGTLDDGTPDPPLTVNLTLSEPSGATLGAQATAVLTITDSDEMCPPPTPSP